MMNGVVAKNKNLRLISRDGKNIVVDKESGSWALLPKKIINILQDIDDKVEVSEFLEKFNISEKEFIGLYKANMFLINGKQYFDYSIYDTYIKKYPSLGVIHITSDCNLRCKYCFANCESGISISEEQIKKQ